MPHLFIRTDEDRRSTGKDCHDVERRYVKHVYRIGSMHTAAGDSRNELDSHADTCVAGSNTLRVSDDDRVVNVHPYTDEYTPVTNIPVATVATLWIHPETGKSYILIINEALYFGDRLTSTLLCPNQMRANGLSVDDVPRQFDANSSHSIYIPEHKLRIPLTLNGVVSGFESVKPTLAEYAEYPHIELTSGMRWEPGSPEMAENESRVAGVSTMEAQTASGYARNVTRTIGAVRAYGDAIGSINGPGDDIYGDALYDRLLATVHVAIDDYDGNGLSGHKDDDVYPMEAEARKLFALSSTEKRSVLTPEILSKRWGIGLESAKRTLTVTTQAGIRNVLAPGERKVRQKLDHLKFPIIKGRIYGDTMFSTLKSIRGNRVAQVFTNGLGFDHFYPLKTKALVPDALVSFINDVGIPETIVTDNAPEEIHGEFKRICRQHHIKQQQTVPYSPWANLAEASIREIKVGIRRAMRRANAPKRLWCYCGQWVTAIRRLTALDNPKLDGRVPQEDVMGSTPDISQYAQFNWYEPVYYYEPTAQFPDNKNLLGRWVGVAEASTNVMAFYILTGTGKVLVRQSVWAITDEERATTEWKEKLADLDQKIRAKIGDAIADNKVDPELLEDLPEIPEYLFEDEEIDEATEKDAVMPEADDYTPEAYDQYITATVLLPQGGESKKATVVGRKKDHDGKPIGKRNANPMLDSRVYEVKFPDGETTEVAANLIAENLFSQIDSEGRSYAILKEIVDHRTNGHALSKDDGFTVDKFGREHPRVTTRGWEILVEWRDGTTSWVALKDLKESNPVELAEYAVANKLVEEPAFKWWVRQTLRCRDRIIKKVKSRYWSKTHKFGIELPKTVAQALAIDAATGTDFWRRAIEKEMGTVMPALELLDSDVPPDFHTLITCHMIFDVKMDLTRKARFVAGGHLTDPPKESTYSSVVSRDSVRIAFTLAALNDLEVLCADVQGAYLNAPTSEKVYFIAGPEFGRDKDRLVKIVRALYGLKSSGANWRAHMAATLRDAGFQSCKADPDVWMRPNTKPNGDKYWEYLLCYVDDLLCISHSPQLVMDYLAQIYTLKEGSVKEPDAYLGAEIMKWTIEKSDEPTKPRWAMSSDAYVKRAVVEVERYVVTKSGKRLPTKVTTPMTQGYRPELDVSLELDSEQATYYQGLIGILRWACELGRIDILVDVTLLSSFLAAPRRGHLEQAFHVFGYLKRYDRSRMVFDDSEPDFSKKHFEKCDWAEYYPGAAEVIPPDAPEPRGKTVTMSCFVDADHAGCRATRRSHTGILIFINRAPILWFSKRQNTVETSTFGSEFVAAKTAVEMIKGLRYKLRMMGVEVDGPTSMFCDNESVVKNVTKPESTLKKKHNAIAYHRVREAQAAGTVRIAHEKGENNLADLFTKCLPGPRLRGLVRCILF